ncbi:MAG TPA: radical SAM protein, partial [bacterium]|nr:radical SAM protein [bacterium]
MTNVTLVMPRFKYAAGDFSLGLASIASYLKQSLKDVQVHAVDATFDPDMEHIAEQLRQHPADITGIFMDTLMYRDALAVARIAKKHSPFVIVGGPHPSILPETVISDDSVDAVCIGEGEQTFSELVSSRKEGKSLEGVKGLWFKSDGAVVKNERRMPIEDIDTLPLPDIEIFDVERYIANFIQLDSYSPNLRGMSVIVSRGCPFGCSYCQPVLDTIFGKRFRIRSPRKTVEDLKYLKQKYRLDGVYFQDDTLTVSRKWMAEFCALAVSERLDMVWACNTRADW